MTSNRRMFLGAMAAWLLLPCANAYADDDGDDEKDHDRKRRRSRRRRKRRRRSRNKSKRYNRSSGKRYREVEEDHDYEAAAKARKSGSIRPLEEILKEVRKVHSGEVVGVEFEKKNGIWVYEIKMVAPDSRFFEIYIDATSKKILKVWGK